ncbi:type II/IV secretion system ATPase subunit [Natrialbaceae archaeon GCM10025810]|uniref:type II/IV secretion system ATPase subunit n=1 Tax=Halovalidus salilacus TaxID=3075124 RepID=UPI0036114834
MGRTNESDGGDREGAGPSAVVHRSRDALGSIGRTIDRIRDVLRGSRIDLVEYDPSEHGPLCAFDGIDGLEELDRYWVDAPFSFVTVQYDPAANHHRYVTVEPTLRADERRFLELLFEDVRDPLLYREREDEPRGRGGRGIGRGRESGGEEGNETDRIESLLRETIHEYLEQYGAEIDVATFYRLFYYVHRDFRGYGRLDPIMHDPHVEDISCDGYDLPIFVYHDEYADVETNVSFAKADLDRFVIRLAQHSGRHISIGDPMVETTLPDGSRAELALGTEVTPRGSAFTVRKYADEPFTPVHLLEYGTFSVEQLAYLWFAIEHNKSLLFAGGTASGKTTSMNAVSMFIPPRSKVLTIEDTRELQLHHDNWLSSVTRERVHEGTDVSMYDLLRSALRHRPEYIVVGEVRGEEAITLFQAMNTGHTTYSTMHADSVQTVINRLENEPINVPRAMVRSLDILSVQTLTRLDDGRVRRNKVIAEIEGIDGRTGELDYSTTYAWNGDDDTFEGRGSRVLEEIREERGWSQRELLIERRNRERFLEYLRTNEITDYRRFTALVNEYYADKEGVLEVIGAGGEAGNGAEVWKDATVGDGGKAGDGAEADVEGAAEVGVTTEAGDSVNAREGGTDPIDGDSIGPESER